MSRSHETRVTIASPVEEVWRALTEAEQIQRWFAPKMRVEPGVGGTHVAHWGPGLEWKTTIEVWEPNRRLRLVETRDRVMSSSAVEEVLEPCRLVQDYFLESEGGVTVLRLVHSGFGSSEGWDREYEGTRGGWAACFLRLKHVVELHGNDPVHNVILTAQCDGMDYATGIARLRAAMPESFREELSGKYEFAGLLREQNGSIVNVSVQPCPIGSVAYLEFLLFGLSEAERAQLEESWRGKLGKLFPAKAA